ncbi:MAG: hypothetical protein LBP72_06630 [Dysgonamonadaceae bacterium]|jgi:hypothetical protein|nr:hypothetical protein [Dysgonamonadaceae bacterium]
MILENIEKFTDYVPTAIGSELNELKPFLEESEQWIQDKLLGPDLYAVIAGLPDTDDLKRNAQAVVCLQAYESAIPFVDLVQTPNGFAVVSNANLAPASKERVERLLEFVARRLTALLDKTISAIRSDKACVAEWKKAPAFEFRTEIVFLTTTELRNYSGNKEVKYYDLDAVHPLVLSFQNQLAEHISHACLNRLLQKRAAGELSEREERAFRAIQTIVGAKMRGENAYPLTEGLVNYMISFSDEFPDYINSPEYRLKLSQKYENKKNDTTFFFG